MTSNLNDMVASRIRAILSSRHLTFADYANQIGMGLGAICRRLNGDVPITLTDLAEFAKSTGYTPAELVADEFVLKQSPSPAREAA